MHYKPEEIPILTPDYGNGRRRRDRARAGPLFHSSLVDCPHEAIHIGMPVEVVFDDVSEDVTLPRFRPRAGASETAASG